MSQVALNTVALFIFCTTGMILFGPLVNLPAAVPVGFVLAALTIASLDMVGFQGKGANVFLDWFAQRSPAYRDRIVHHEAGHFLVAYLLDIPILDYTLSATEALQAGYSGIGGVRLKPMEAQPGDREEWARYCAVCMAGRAAEQLSFQAVQGGMDDLHWLRSQAQSFAFNAQKSEQQGSLTAKRLLKENWDSYTNLIENMNARKSVQECCQGLAKFSQAQSLQTVKA